MARLPRRMADAASKRSSASPAAEADSQARVGIVEVRRQLLHRAEADSAHSPIHDAGASSSDVQFVMRSSISRCLGRDHGFRSSNIWLIARYSWCARTVRKDFQPLPPQLRPGRDLHPGGARGRPGVQRRQVGGVARSRAPARDPRALPRAGLSAYSCEDLFHQQALLDGTVAALGAHRRRLGEIPVSRSSGCRWPSTACSSTARWSCTAGEPSGRRRRPPAELPRVLREAAVHPGRRRAPRGRSSRRSDVPFGTRPGVRAPDQPLFASTSRSARTLWTPIPPSRTRRWPARRCCQPLGEQHHHRQGGYRHELALASRRAASRPISTAPRGSASRPPTSPGTATR